MADTLREQANKVALEAVKAEKPAQFTVGGTFDGTTVTGGVTIDRKWANGWGLTAYARAWWNAKAVLPQEKTGVVVGIEGVKKF